MVQANNRWQMNNGHMDGPAEPEHFLGGMPGFPNMPMGPQMGFVPPMGMGMGMGMGMPMGLGPMGPMGMNPMGMGNGMPGMLQETPSFGAVAASEHSSNHSSIYKYSL